MKRRSWSLAGRLTGLFLVSTILFTLAIALFSGWFLHRSIQRELDQLLTEEIGELHSAFPRVAGDVDAFRGLIDEFSASHPSFHLACRVWDASGETVWGTFGHAPLAERALFDPHALDRHTDLGGGLLWRAERLSNGQIVAMVIDGSRQLRLFERYEVYAALLVVGSTLAAVVLARMFFRRVSRLLETVAERARSVQRADATVAFDMPDAPREIQQIVDALHAMLTNIRRESEEARVFIASLAHELRSPVQNLVGETEVALRAERDVAAYQQVLGSNLEELRELGDTIDNLVTICSAGSNRRSEVREAFDLAEEARLRVQRESAAAARAGIELRLAVSGDTHLDGDREALLRALRNLTANAIQWSPPGARVDVELRGTGDEIVVTVDDAGPGVPDALRAKIFEPFFRGPAVAGQRIGYGLGLALARTAAEAHGGRIEVGTSPAGGARFRMRLPRRHGELALRA